jgi:hypothetical protein
MAHNDSWEKSVYNACSQTTFYSNATADPLRGVGSAELLQVKHDFAASEERVGLIAKRILVAEEHKVDSFVKAEPLLDKAMVQITYREGDANRTMDARVEDAQDVEQLEIFRINKALIDRVDKVWPVPDTSSCSVQ